MKKMMLICSLLALAAGPALAESDLASAVSGKTIQGSMNKSGNYTEYYAPDGTIKGKDYTGKWRINENGEMCVLYSSDPTEACWKGSVDNNKVTWTRGGQEDGSGVISDGDIGGFRDGDGGRR